MPVITETCKGVNEEVVPPTALGREAVTGVGYLMMLKPRLPRTIITSPRVNLNDYWDDLTTFYEAQQKDAAYKLPLSNGLTPGTNAPVIGQGQKGANEATQPLTVIGLNDMVERFHIYTPEQ